MKTLEEDTAKILSAYRDWVKEGVYVEFDSMDSIKKALRALGYTLQGGKLQAYVCKGFIVCPSRPDLVGIKFNSFVTDLIVETDTGISFAHYKDARRDENFHKLQELRKSAFVFVNGGIFQL